MQYRHKISGQDRTGQDRTGQGLSDYPFFSVGKIYVIGDG